MNQLSKEQCAHLEVVKTAILYTRNELYRVDDNSKVGILADLLDAIHNTPEFVEKMFCSSAEYVNIYYESFDKKYPDSISLVSAYYQALNENI